MTKNKGIFGVLVGVFLIGVGAYWSYSKYQQNQINEIEVHLDREFLKFKTAVTNGKLLYSAFEFESDQKNPSNFTQCLNGIGKNCVQYSLTSFQMLENKELELNSKIKIGATKNCSETEDCDFQRNARYQISCEESVCSKMVLQLEVESLKTKGLVRRSEFEINPQVLAKAYFSNKYSKSDILSRLQKLSK